MPGPPCVYSVFQGPGASKNTFIFVFKQYHEAYVSVFFILLGKLKDISLLRLNVLVIFFF